MNPPPYCLAWFVMSHLTMLCTHGGLTAHQLTVLCSLVYSLYSSLNFLLKYTSPSTTHCFLSTSSTFAFNGISTPTHALILGNVRIKVTIGFGHARRPFAARPRLFGHIKRKAVAARPSLIAALLFLSSSNRRD